MKKFPIKLKIRILKVLNSRDLLLDVSERKVLNSRDLLLNVSEQKVLNSRDLLLNVSEPKVLNSRDLLNVSEPKVLNNRDLLLNVSNRKVLNSRDLLPTRIKLPLTINLKVLSSRDRLRSRDLLNVSEPKVLNNRDLLLNVSNRKVLNSRDLLPTRIKLPLTINLKVLSSRDRLRRGVPVPFVSKNRRERFEAIGDEIARSSYDLVALQEVWHKGDFEILKRKIGNVLPYNHYFYSGSIGSGLCLFSKHPIVETIYHRFDPNGYCYRVQHGDWFGGKGLGLARLNILGTILHLYVTHIHAEYNREKDEYRAHRTCQSFSVSQFIKLTSSQAQVSFLCGDLNLEPVDQGYKMIRCNGNLKDAWIEKQSTKSEDKDGNTSGCRSNSYSGNRERPKRIDYILYKAADGTHVEIEDCSLTMGRVPGKNFSYSDHEGVEATISVDRKPGKVSENSQDMESLPSLLQESINIVDKGLEQTNTNRKFFIAFSVICLALAYLISVIHIPYPLDYFVAIFKLLLILSMGFGIVQSLIMIRSEVHGLEAGRQDMKNLLQNIS